MLPAPHEVTDAPSPIATISRRAADRLRAGHLWVYRSDTEQLNPATPAPGALINVVDNRAIPLGTALYSDASEIALRIVSRRPGLTRADYLIDLRERLRAALDLRTRLVPESFASSPEPAATHACRLIFSEADDLPGIVADRYNDIVVLQLLTQGTAQDDVRRAIVEELSAHPWLATLPRLTIIERPDPRIRELEHLAPAPAEPLFIRANTAPTLSTVFSINGLRFHFDAASGQKTGAFLDQRLNYAAAAQHAHGRALDVCTYQGGFALHLARTCSHVTGVDASRVALEVADRNLTLNPNLSAQVNWIEADAFDVLREWDFSAARFDTLVLDPPAFAKSKRAAEGALRGYKELNLRALKMLSPGGTLVTCSCSHHVALEDFLAVLRAAASDADRRVLLLETRGAAPDHPAILTLPETSYLKCLICRVG
jgi:23S rRNA (cytosine1962-C5)-methyltransferase